MRQVASNPDATRRSAGSAGRATRGLREQAHERVQVILADRAVVLIEDGDAIAVAQGLAVT
jgi:hypothetical protein